MFNHLRFRRAAIASVMVVWSFACHPSPGKEPHPELKYETPMTHDAFYSDLGHKTEAEGNQLQHLLLDPDTMFDAQKRKALLTTVKPLQLQYQADYKELGTKFPGMQKYANEIDEQTTQRLALLGDEDTLAALSAQAAGPDVSKAMNAQCILVANDWTLADNDTKKQSDIADRLEKLDQAHPESDALTAVSFKLSGESSTESSPRSPAGLGDGYEKLHFSEDVENETNSRCVQSDRNARRQTLRAYGQD